MMIIIIIIIITITNEESTAILLSVRPSPSTRDHDTWSLFHQHYHQRRSPLSVFVISLFVTRIHHKYPVTLTRFSSPLILLIAVNIIVNRFVCLVSFANLCQTTRHRGVSCLTGIGCSMTHTCHRKITASQPAPPIIILVRDTITSLSIPLSPSHPRRHQRNHHHHGGAMMAMKWQPNWCGNDRSNTFRLRPSRCYMIICVSLSCLPAS